ncbi:hypothetical protein [Aquimarina sediminis]|uniref:hypothetical protein n=1 Tax=Aquimarina sediminis TaxID=2070536 RepID=UPI000FFE36B0|nr:hypothetical protein [Aquimarina sediminis]
MSSTYKNISLDFEKAILQMQDDLRYLVNKGKVNKGFIAKQNRILKALITYYKSSAQTYSDTELAQMQNKHDKEIEILTDRIIQFEAICIMHGIIDFPILLDLPKSILIDQAAELHREGGFRCSAMLKTFIKKLPSEKKTLFENILFERIDNELKAIFQKIKNKPNKHIRKWQ